MRCIISLMLRFSCLFFWTYFSACFIPARYPRGACLFPLSLNYCGDILGRVFEGRFWGIMVVVMVILLVCRVQTTGGMRGTDSVVLCKFL